MARLGVGALGARLGPPNLGAPDEWKISDAEVSQKPKTAKFNNEVTLEDFCMSVKCPINEVLSANVHYRNYDQL